MTVDETPGTQTQVPPTWKAAVRGNVLAMGLVSLFTDFSSEMMNPLLPIFIAGLVGGVKAATWVGLMEGIAETTAAILKIYSGRISDKTGKRKALVILGYGASSVSRPLMALAGLVAMSSAGLQIVVLKFLDRVGKGVRTSPRDALIGDSVPKEYRGLAFSFHRVMDNTGAVLGPIVAIAILYFLIGPALWTESAMKYVQPSAGGAEHAGAVGALRWLFALAVVPGVLAMLAAVLMVREIHPPPATGNGPLKGVWGMPRKFYAYVSIVTLFTLGNSSDMFIVLLAAMRFNMSFLMLLVLWISLNVSKIVFSIPGGILSDKLGRRPIIISGWIVYALVYLGFAFADPNQQWQFWTLIFIYGIYFGMTEGVEKALVADFIPSERRGTAFGLYNAALGIASLPANLVFGALWVWIEANVGKGMGGKVAFSMGAALAGLATVLLAILLATGKKPKPQAA
jgi:MFS family permease